MLNGYWTPNCSTCARLKPTSAGESAAFRMISTGPEKKLCGMTKIPDPPRITVLPESPTLYAKPIRGENELYWGVPRLVRRQVRAERSDPVEEAPVPFFGHRVKVPAETEIQRQVGTGAEIVLEEESGLPARHLERIESEIESHATWLV